MSVPWAFAWRHLGVSSPEGARAVFREQISALAATGADLLILETFSDLDEIREAVAAAMGVCDLPIVASMTFTRDDRTVLGDSPTKVAQMLAETGADVIGVNCSGGPAQIWRILRQMHQTLSGIDGHSSHQKDTPVRPYLSAMPNAGWPERVGERIMYLANPDYFGEYALAFCDAGAMLIGGCCGTTPAHIASMHTAIENSSIGCGPTLSELSMPVETIERLAPEERPSHLAQKLAVGKFVISVEMNPPRGLSAHKTIAGANLLNESGADVINVSDSPMARMRMSPWAVCDLIQSQVEIETTLHFPTRGRSLLRVQGDLLAAHALGIRNVFVVMGDPTSIGDYPDVMDDYDLVPSGLIKLIKDNFNDGVDQSGADIGQPTSYLVGCALNLCPPDSERETKILHRKLLAGADFFLTQPVYEPEIAERFLKRYTEEFGPLETPILVGVLPLYGPWHASFLHNEVPGITIPDAILRRLMDTGEQSPQEGVFVALELIEQMKSWVSGIYLMPSFSRYNLAAEIVEACS
ncbi:bifunctional homocysteine S-methyltransferase/methylenetetrahydrofolate reductase [Chloroflexota bacterium]